MQIYCKITNGKIPQYALNQLNDAARKMDGKKLTIKVTKETRSSQQNRYRWGIVVETIKDIMNKVLREKGLPEASAEDIDLYVKENALGLVHRIKTKSGELVIQGRLKDKTKEEFEESMEAIRAWGAEHGIIIPLPNENQYGEYK